MSDQTPQIQPEPQPLTKPKKNKKKTLIIIAIIIGFLVVCCGAAAIIGNSTNKSTTTTPSSISNSTELNPSLSTPLPITATAILSTPTITFTPLPSETPISAKEKTATQQMREYTSTALVRTKVSESKRATATEVASYKGIFVKDLATYADNHIGERIKMYVVVFNINGDTELQGYMNGTYEPLYVVMAEPFDDIYENNGITVYGTVAGEECGENAFGAEICQPMIVDSFYTK
jgi:hypothetical protein